MVAHRTDAMPSTPRTLVDDSDCGGCNTGQCVEPTFKDAYGTGFDSSSTSLGSQPNCDCKNTGFIGMHCEVECSKVCQNGGKCIPASESTSGEESCSCSKAVVDGNPFAGLDCEFGATKSCMTLGSESKHSFCTNGGECQDIITDNQQHKDCICEGGFEGPHCEYVVGTAPVLVSAANAAEGVYDQSSKAKSTNMVVYSMIAVIAALIAVLLLAFGLRARKRKSDAKRMEREVREATEELSMIPTHNNVEKENEII